MQSKLGPTMDNELQIIIMDDDFDYASYLSDVAETLDLSCNIITNAHDFMQKLNKSVSLIFLDLNIPDLDGIELLRYIEKTHSQCHIILMSGVEERILESAEAFAKSLNLSVLGRFQKTIRLADLEEFLKKSINSIATKTTKNEKVKFKKLNFSATREELLRAIKEEEFVMQYQPKIDIATRGLVGVEALIRWLHPKHQLLFPDNFIPEAESMGLIDELSWQMIKKSLKEIEELQKNIQLHFKLSLNLSTHTLKDLNFSHKFTQIIEQSKLPAENIVFEITESELINDLSAALATFTRLRLKNILLSIDDFGTGYSMMQQLRDIPATEIKIDKSFVQSMLNENSSRVTVQKIIEIGHELGMKVVAEGVETKEQLYFLQNHNCDIAQGYYFSKPLFLEQLQQWIDNHYTQF